MPQNRFLTKNGLEIAQKKLKGLENELNFVLSQKGEASEVGGNTYHDNAAFETLVRKEQMILSDIKNLRDIINTAEIIEEKLGNKKIGIGSIVLVKSENGQEAEYKHRSRSSSSLEYKIVGLMESDPSKNRISYETPLGSALMGAKKGEKKEFSAGGKKKIVEILEVK